MRGVRTAYNIGIRTAYNIMDSGLVQRLADPDICIATASDTGRAGETNDDRSLSQERSRRRRHRRLPQLVGPPRRA